MRPRCHILPTLLIALIPLTGLRRGAAGYGRGQGPVERARVPPHRPSSGGACLSGHRRARRRPDLLRRHCEPAESGSRSTVAESGHRSSTTSRSRRSGRSRSRRRTRTWCGSARERPTFAAMWPRATASTARPTPARPGNTCGPRRVRSGPWRSIPKPGCGLRRGPRQPLWSRALIVGFFGRLTAGRRGRRCCTRTPTPAHPMSASTRRTRGSSSPDCGRPGVSRGE